MTQMNSGSSAHRDDPLPWPSGFGSGRPRGAFLAGTVLFAVAVPFFIGTCLSAISEHHWPTAIFGAAGAFGALVFTVLCGYYLRRRRSRVPGGVRADAIEGVSAVTIPTVKVAVIALLSFSAAAIAVAAARLLLLFTEDDRTNAARSALTAVVMTVLLSGGLWLVWIGLSVSRKPKALRLSPDGVDLRNGFIHQYLPWNSTAAVQATITDRNPSIHLVPAEPSALLVEQTSRVKQRTNLDRVVLPPTAYGVDPALLYYTLDFYWRHPELRGELASDIAVERMRRGEVMG